MNNILVLAIGMMAISNMAYRSAKYDISALAAVVATLIALVKLSFLVSPGMEMTPGVIATLFVVISAAIATLLVLLKVFGSLLTTFSVLLARLTNAITPPTSIGSSVDPKEVWAVYVASSLTFYISAAIALIFN